MSSVVEVNGAGLHVQEVGDGPVALVLHGGLGIDHRSYRSLDPLAEHLGLVYYDHRGNGRSTCRPATMSMSRSHRGVDLPLVGDALQHVRPPVLEADVRPRDEVLHGA